MEWVVGFLVARTSHDEVVLIRKNRPAWQAGRLNGVGGKIEPGETPVEAMRREFAEETGLEVDDWEPFADIMAVTVDDRTGTVTADPGVVHFFRAFTDRRVRSEVRQMTDEQVEVHRLERVLHPDYADHLIPNLRWLLPLAVHRADTYETIQVVETATTLRTPQPA